MGKSKSTDNSKKAQGNARKAAAADKKRQEEEERLEAAEADEWSKGSKKGNAKKEAEAEKKAEAARRKAEREALLKEEEASLPSKPKRGKEKVSERKTKSLDAFLSGQEKKGPTIHASGIDDALTALSLTEGSKVNKSDIDRHPERRVKAAKAAYIERRLPELKEEHPGLRQNQYINLLNKEFEKSPENPMNQVTVAYNATMDDVREKKTQLRKAAENRLTED